MEILFIVASVLGALLYRKIIAPMSENIKTDYRQSKRIEEEDKAAKEKEREALGLSQEQYDHQLNERSEEMAFATQRAEEDRMWGCSFSTEEIDKIMNQRLEREFIEGKKQGEFTRYSVSGQIEERGYYIDHKADSKYTWYYKNGVVEGQKYCKEGKRLGDSVPNFLYGVKHGEFTSFYDNGQIKERGSYVNGIQHGEFTSFYDNGQIKERGNYVNGKKHGEFTSYYDSGQVEERENFVDGKKHGKYAWYYNNGMVKGQGHFVDGKKHGEYNWYYDSGQVKEQLSFKRGEKRRTYTLYHENGQIMKRGNIVGHIAKKLLGK